jgi:hypothetical protein
MTPPVAIITGASQGIGGLVVHGVYNRYWFWGRQSIVDLWHDLPAATREIRSDWDLSAPGLRQAWDAGTSPHSTAGTSRRRPSRIPRDVPGHTTSGTHH